MINSGNANAATGAEGLGDAERVCAQAGRLLQLEQTQVQPYSTGVIGERLPVEKMNRALNDAYGGLREDGWLDAAVAIMTTDTVPKGVSKQLELDGRTVTITGIAKGSGMLKPNMATMLAYMGCDASVAADVVQQLVNEAAQRSFNRITVDGDTSTNDSLVVHGVQRVRPVTPRVDRPGASG